MLAQESVREGRLDDALAEAQAQVRKEPGNAQHRVLLFQLLAVIGRWDRSLAQLEMAGELDPRSMPMVYTYRAAISAEAVRASVFTGQASPGIIGEPQEWMAWLIEALRLTAKGDHAQGGEFRAKAFEVAPPTPGEVDGTAFDWIADADARLGPMLEVIINGRYAWLPFQRVRAIRLEPPADLRDLVWMPLFVTLQGGAEVAALAPTRYPGSEASADPRIRLCRRTEWTELGAATGCWAGAGQRMLASDRGEHPFMDLRSIQFLGEDRRGRSVRCAPDRA